MTAKTPAPSRPAPSRHSVPFRWALLLLGALTTAAPIGCHAPPPTLRNAQWQALHQHQQNTVIARDRDAAYSQLANVTQQNEQLAARNASLEHRAAKLERDVDIAHRRLTNLASERTKLHDRHVSLLKKLNDHGNPMPEGTTRRFQDLARRYPEFEFDPQTGVSKFHADVLFNSGSAVVKRDAHPVLKEFAEIMNEGQAGELKILVVGHTDDKAILKPVVKAKHPTNWHLSTNRADSVVLLLEKFGLSQNRMGAAGYSMFQPIATNTDESGRQRNRRVEIYVLAPDAVVAGWDPKSIERR